MHVAERNMLFTMHDLRYCPHFLPLRGFVRAVVRSTVLAWSANRVLIAHQTICAGDTEIQAIFCSQQGSDVYNTYTCQCEQSLLLLATF